MNDQIPGYLLDPTRCMATGCEAENEIVLHLSDDPWRGASLCLPHAREAAASTPLVVTCPCDFCVQARAVL